MCVEGARRELIRTGACAWRGRLVRSNKTRKGSTKKGSKKEKGKKDEFESLLGESSAPLISQQMFVGGGLATVLVVAVIAVMMSGVLN